MKVCQHCEFENFFNIDVCEKCGMELIEKTSPTANDDPSEFNPYFLEAILTTIFCCSPIGIVAIIYAVKAKSKIKIGDMQSAVEYSQEARMWYWIALGVSLTLLTFYFFVKINF